MAVYEDIHCQWCKGIIGISTESGMLTVYEVSTDHAGKFYHDSTEKPCWSTLVDMATRLGKRP